MNRRNLIAGIAAAGLLPGGEQASASKLIYTPNPEMDEFYQIAGQAYEDALSFLDWYVGDGRGDRFSCVFHVYIPINLYDVQRRLEFSGPTCYATLNFHVDKVDVGLFSVLVLPTFDYFVFKNA